MCAQVLRAPALALARDGGGGPGPSQLRGGGGGHNVVRERERVREQLLRTKTVPQGPQCEGEGDPQGARTSSQSLSREEGQDVSD